MNQVFEMGSQLQKSGMTAGWLILVAVLFSITFILSTRELILWYFKSHHLHSQIDEIKESLSRIEQRLNEQTFKITPTSPPTESIPMDLPPPTTKENQKPFTLNH